MADHSPQDFRVNQMLKNILIGYTPKGFVAPDLMPVIDVEAQGGMYPIIERAEAYRESETLRAPGTAPNEVTFQVNSGSYFCPNYALGGNTPLEVLANQDKPWNVAAQTGQVITAKLWLGWETRCQRLFSTQCGSSLNRTGAAAWSNYGGSDPLGDIDVATEAIRQSTQEEPNVAVMSTKLWKVVRRHPDLIRAAKAATLGGGILTKQEFQGLIGVDKFLVAGAIKNVGQMLQKELANYKDVWSTGFILAHVAANPGIMVPSFAYSFRWKGPAQNGMGGMLPGDWTPQTFVNRKTGSLEQQIGYYQDEKPVDPTLGFQINTGVV